MTISFVLNGVVAKANVEPNVRLLDMLRDSFNLYKTKCGCLSGSCGGCTVLFNGEAALSCVIPAFRVRDSEVLTLEGFEKQSACRDIMAGFTQTGVRLCDFCAPSKIFITETLLRRKSLPEQEIDLAFGGIKCRCTDMEKLRAGVLAAARVRERRR